MSIHKLELHESYIVDSNIEVIKVPGGWIYLIKHPPFNQLVSVYVPYSGEFKDDKPKEIPELPDNEYTII